MRPALFHMIFMKHKEHGNAHVADADQAQLDAEGWVRWPRTKDQKAGVVGVVVAAPVPPTQAGPQSRDSLLLDAAAKGLKVDRRWSDARIAEELAKA